MRGLLYVTTTVLYSGTVILLQYHVEEHSQSREDSAGVLLYTMC